MKKYLSLTFLLFFITAFLAACTGAPRKSADLPEPGAIRTVEITVDESDVRMIDDSSDISAFVKTLNENAKSTGRESVNDQPTNVEKYVCVKLVHGEDPALCQAFYLYEHKGRKYLEKPYEGIWELPDEAYFDAMSFCD